MCLIIINNIFVAFLLHIYNCNIYEKKNTNKVLFFGAWCGVIILFSMQELYKGRMPIVNMLLFLLPYFTVTVLFYYATIRKILLYTFYFYVVGICCEVVTYYGTCMLFGYEKSINGDKILQIISNILMFIVIRLFILLLGKGEECSLRLVDFLEIFLIPAGSIYLIICIYVINNCPVGIWNLLAVIIIITFNIVSYYFYIQLQENMKDKYKALLLENQNKCYIQESRRVTELWKNINEFKHNFKYIKETNKLNYRDVALLYGFEETIANSGCVAIDAIINNRASRAGDSNIELNVDLKIASDLQVNENDISVILCNLLDNAIEANILCAGKRYINVKLETDLRNENTLIISIENPYTGNIIKSRNGEFKSGKKDCYRHGIRLKSVRQIVEMHNGVMKIRTDNNVFSVQIIIFNVCD